MVSTFRDIMSLPWFVSIANSEYEKLSGSQECNINLEVYMTVAHVCSYMPL